MWFFTQLVQVTTMTQWINFLGENLHLVSCATVFSKSEVILTCVQWCWNWGAGEGALCVDMGFYEDISWESRCNIEINVWPHFYKILLVFEVPYRPWVKGMPQKYSRLRCLLRVKGLVICFYLGWFGSALLITKHIIKIGSKS